MEFIPLGNYAHRGMGLELDPEAEAIRQRIRESWSEQETEARAIGPSLREMAHTFTVAHPRLVEHLNYQNKVGKQRKRAKERAAE